MQSYVRAPVCRISFPSPRNHQFKLRQPSNHTLHLAPWLHLPSPSSATSAMPHPPCSAVQVGWTPSHTGIADAAAKLSAEGNPPGDLMFRGLHSEIRDRLLQEWQVWHKPRDDFPFWPSTKLSAIFTLPRHAATRLFQTKLAASCPRCEEEVETTGHAMLCCPAYQYARGSFPEALGLKSAWYDATTAIDMLATFVQRTLTAYPPGSTPPEVIGTPSPCSSSP